ncbi:trypsin-like peptidase domain-containing protein [Streptomyces sp. NPDC052109]|uniref:trypsin-like peptidase domain-containing protein n=1 Tax=Streptomyces sp. NPDC052109 TaxID=3155527 RepID=UPI00342D411A
MAGLRGDRVAEVVARCADGTRPRGSGYLVATNLVLTAAHVVRDADTVTVRFNPDRTDEWSAPARVGWFGPDRTDAALLEIDPGAVPFSRQAEPVRLGAPGEDNAVLTCSAVGFPLFKMRRRPDGSRARDACHAWGHVPVLSNRRTGTLEFRVPPPEGTAQGSPWEGMSGAAVWAEGRVIGIVVEHHPAEGPGTLTVSRADRWAGTSDGPGAELLRRAGLAVPPEQVGPPAGDVRVAEGYQAQARSIAPPALLGRETELEAVLRFCAGPSGYQWWQAPPWHGKTAFTAWLAAHPPAGVAVAAFFVTRRDATQCDSHAFAQAMAAQLASLAGESMVHAAAPGVHVREWLRLLEAAAGRQGRRGRLLVIVDGLDEDLSQTASPPRPSIASLLPRRLPDGVSVLVTSRPLPEPAADLPGDHPLRDCEPLTLAASPHAARLRYEAEYEVKGLLAEDSAERQVIGLLAAAGEGLSRDELGALTGMPARRLDALTGGTLARSLAERTFPVFLDDSDQVRTALVFAHDTLLTTALRLLGAELPPFRERIHRWADTYKERGWPPDTPHFLLSGYGRLIVTAADPGRIARVVADPVRQDRMASRLLGAGPALAELRTARARVAQDDTEDGLRSAVLLAAAHARVTARHVVEAEDGELALLRGRLGQTDRAQALAEAIPEDGARCFALIRLADLLAESEPRRALALAKKAAELVRAAPPSSYRSVPALAAVRAGGVLMRLGSPEGTSVLHAALGMVAAEHAAAPREPAQGSARSRRSERLRYSEPARWTDQVLVMAAESFGAAGDMDGVRAVWSADGHSGGRRMIWPHALTALARHGRRFAPDRPPDGAPDDAPEVPAWPAAARAAWPAALAAAGAGEEAWHAVDTVPPGDRDVVLGALSEAFGEAGELAQALRAARAVAGAEARRRAVLDLAARAPDAREGLRLIEEACPHGHDTAAAPADWPCGGACGALRLRALGTLDRWEEALAVAALPYPAPFRREARRQTLTVLALRGDWQQALDLLARYRSEDEPEGWIGAAVSMVYAGSHAGRPEAVELAQELLAAPPEALSRDELARLESLALPVLAGAGRWQALATYCSTWPEPLRHLFLNGIGAGIAEAVAELLVRQPARRTEALDALGPVFGTDVWCSALARACARQGQWRTAASMARTIEEPLSRRTALTRVAHTLVEREPRYAADLADEAERTPRIAHPGRFGGAAGTERALLDFAEALAPTHPEDAVDAAQAARSLASTEETLGRCAVVLARVGEGAAADDLLKQLDDRRWRCRTLVALTGAAVTAGRQDEARRLATAVLASSDTAAVPECVALVAAAGFHGPATADGLRRQAVGWAATRLRAQDTLESLTAVLRHCPATDRATVSAAVRVMNEVFGAGRLTPAGVLPLATCAALALERLDQEAAARFATMALEAAAALDPVWPGEAPASAVADATALLCRVGDLTSALTEPESRISHGSTDVLPMLLAGAGAGAADAVPDWAAARARAAADLLHDYRGPLGVHPALRRQEFIFTEPVLDSLTVAARALAALDGRPAARALLERVPGPWQRDLAWVRLARGLAADAGRPDAHLLVQDAAEWALRQALAGERWTEALPLVAARRPEAVVEAFALMRRSDEVPLRRGRREVRV